MNHPQDPGPARVRFQPDPGYAPDGSVSEAETLELIGGMTDLTIMVLRAARSVEVEGEGEFIARLEILDRCGPSFDGLAPPVRGACESHIRRVVAEFFGRRESWEG